MEKTTGRGGEVRVVGNCGPFAQQQSFCTEKAYSHLGQAQPVAMVEVKQRRRGSRCPC